MPRDRQAEPQLLLKVFVWSRVVGVEAVAGGWSGWRPRPSARVSLPEGSIQEMRIQWLLRGKKSPGQESAVGCGQGLGGPGCQTRALPPGRWAAPCDHVSGRPWWVWRSDSGDQEQGQWR